MLRGLGLRAVLCAGRTEVSRLHLSAQHGRAAWAAVLSIVMARVSAESPGAVQRDVCPKAVLMNWSGMYASPAPLHPSYPWPWFATKHIPIRNIVLEKKSFGCSGDDVSPHQHSLLLTGGGSDQALPRGHFQRQLP